MVNNGLTEATSVFSGGIDEHSFASPQGVFRKGPFQVFIVTETHADQVLIGWSDVEDFNPIRVVIVFVSQLVIVGRGDLREDELGMGWEWNPKE